MSQLADLDNPPKGVTNWSGLCACDKRRNWHRALKYTQIQNAARNSCRLCCAYEKVILAVVDGCLPTLFQGPRDEAERTRILDELVVGKAGPIFADEECDLELRIMSKRVVIELFRDAEEQSYFSVRGIEFPEGVQYGPGTNSDRGFGRAERWLRQCLEHHSCGEPGSVRYPKRLLDLRKDQIRLFETNRTNDCEAPYVCLSHCWGGPQYRRLTSKVTTIQNHMQGIAWDELPRTFQDAVTICRRMCVSYLWIDALCILQEFPGMSDEEAKKTRADFVEENSAMAGIYRNSYFTICASISTSMASGIFSTKEYVSHQIKVIDDSGNEAFFRIREKTSHTKPPTDLETRCWTYQEYLLPPRVLGFESFDISWRCKESHTCECGRITGAWNWPEQLAEQSRTPQDAREAKKWWWRVLRFYTARNLTHEQDKLPALSGLAQVYQEATGDTYLAGLWKASLPHCLCWYHTKESGRAPIRIGISCRPRAFRAPSWSWASVDALDNAECRVWWPEIVAVNPIGFKSPKPRMVCTIYEAACQLKTDDAFGEVIGGFVKLGAICIAAKIGTAPQEENGAWTLSYVEDGSDVHHCLADCRLEDDGLELGDEVYCVPIFEDLTEWHSDRGCLVLKQLQGQEYRRVGFCILRKKNPSWNGPYDYDDYDDLPDLTTAENAEKVQSYALQYSPNVEVRITIV
ncbi:hypothetical protein AAE478_010457 [Parahypoxylon ruwenzoriense]